MSNLVYIENTTQSKQIILAPGVVSVDTVVVVVKLTSVSFTGVTDDEDSLLP